MNKEFNAATNQNQYPVPTLSKQEKDKSWYRKGAAAAAVASIAVLAACGPNSSASSGETNNGTPDTPDAEASAPITPGEVEEPTADTPDQAEDEPTASPTEQVDGGDNSEVDESPSTPEINSEALAQFEAEPTDPSQAFLKSMYEGGYGVAGSSSWIDKLNTEAASMDQGELAEYMTDHSPRHGVDESGNEVVLFSDPSGETAKQKVLAQMRQDLVVDMSARQDVSRHDLEYAEFNVEDAKIITDTINKYLFDSPHADQDHANSWVQTNSLTAAGDLYEAFTGRENDGLMSEAEFQGDLDYAEADIQTKTFFHKMAEITDIKRNSVNPGSEAHQLFAGREDFTEGAPDLINNTYADSRTSNNIQLVIGDPDKLEVFPVNYTMDDIQGRDIGAVIPREFLNITYEETDEGTNVLQFTNVISSFDPRDKASPDLEEYYG